MALPLVVDGVTFNYPQPGDRGNAQDATDWADAVTDAIATLQTDVDTLQLQPFISASSTAATTITGNATTAIPFATVAVNYLSSFVGATGVFTCPIAGDYIVSFEVGITVTSGAALNLHGGLYINGVSTQDFGPDLHTSDATQTTQYIQGSVTVRLSLNDTVGIRVTNGVATGRALSGVASRNFISIKKVP